MFRSMLLSGSALALAVLAVPRAGAETASTIALPPVAVTAASPGSLTVPAVEEQRRNLFQTPASVGFVDSESYKGGYANNLRDMLQDTPGVFVQNRYGQEQRLSVRGSGLGRDFHNRGVEVMLDGIPTNLADGIGDFYGIDPLGLRSAEIYKGGNALQYGTTTLGGAINFVSPTARTAVAPNILRFEAGSFGTWRGNFQVSRVLGDFDFMISGTVSHADGFRQHATQQYQHLNANFGYRIAPNVETRFFAGVYVTDQKLPGTLTLNRALTSPRNADALAVSQNHARNLRTERLANRTTVTFDNGRFDLDSWLIHQTLFHPIPFVVLDYDGITYGIAPRLTVNFDVGGMRDEVVVGGRLYGGNNRARVYGNDRGSRGPLFQNGRQNAWNAEAYFENRLFVLPTVAVVAGAKMFHAMREFNDLGGGLFNAPPVTSKREYDGIVPKIGLLWEPVKDIQVFTNVTASQDVPDLLDLTAIGSQSAFVPLRAQKATTLEIGTRGRYDRFAWDITAYRSWVDGQMLAYNVVPGVPSPVFNAGRTILQGIELGVSADLGRGILAPEDKLTLTQLWNYSDFRFGNDRQYGKNTLAGVPSHVLRTTLTYKHPSGFYISPSLDWVPEGAWVDYANTQRVPNYLLFGLRAGMDFENGLSVFLDARNLTDKRYISDFGPVTKYSAAGAGATATFYPGDGRSVYLGARMKF